MMDTRGIKAVIRYVIGYMLLHVLLFFLFQIGSETVQAWMEPLQHWPDARVLLLLFMIQEVIILGLLWAVFVRWKPTKKRFVDLWRYVEKRSPWKGRGPIASWVIGGAVIYYIGNGLLAGLLTYLEIQIPGLYGEQMVVTMISEIDIQLWREYLIVFLLVMVIGPLVEEIIYRAFMTDLLAKSRGGWGVVLAAAIFAVAHLEWGVMFNLFLLSLFLGVIYRRSGSMIYSFLFHVLINGLSLVMLFLVQAQVVSLPA